MADLDRTVARALVEAGYMPLRRYLEIFGDVSPNDAPPIVPDVADESAGDRVYEAPLRFWRQLTSMH